jgi:uncharacterized membrane protein YfcA
MSLADILILGGCCVAAAATQSVSGFGFGLVLVALLPVFGFPIEETVVLVTLLVMPNLGIGAWRLRRHLRWRPVAWVLVGVPLGLPAGLYLLQQGPAWLLRALLGAVLIFTALVPQWRRGREPGPERRRWAVLAGACSGALGGALSTGGPPVVIYFYQRQWGKELTRAATVLTFVGTVSMRLVAYVPAGLLTADRLVRAAALIPAVVVGSMVGERVFRSMSQAAFRRAVAAMLAVCGLYQLARAAGLW